MQIGKNSRIVLGILVIALMAVVGLSGRARLAFGQLPRIDPSKTVQRLTSCADFDEASHIARPSRWLPSTGARSFLPFSKMNRTNVAGGR